MKQKLLFIATFIAMVIVPSIASAQYYIQLGNKCYTPYQWCRIMPAPMYAACYCYSDYFGVTYGTVGR